jgi:hypothetical protein
MWIISDKEADEVIGYLRELQTIKPSDNLSRFIKRFENTTNFNRGKEM